MASDPPQVPGFDPPWWLRGPHAQTIGSALMPRTPSEHRAILRRVDLDDGDALASVLFDLHADPLRAGAGLAEAATRKHQPRPPIGDGWLLVRTSDDAPLPAQRLKVRVSPCRLLQHLALQVAWQQCQPLQR